MVASTDEEAFKIGPLSDEAKKAAKQIRLVLTYAEQNATLNALIEVSRKTTFNPQEALSELYWPHYDDQTCFEDIRRIAGNAPIFEQLVHYLRKINNESIIPEKTIPSDKLVNKIVADYHQWIKEKSER